MYRNLFFCIFGALFWSISFSDGYWLPLFRWGREMDGQTDLSEINNKTEILREFPSENSINFEENALLETLNSTIETEVIQIKNESEEPRENLTESNTLQDEENNIILMDPELSVEADELAEANEQTEHHTKDNYSNTDEKIKLPRTNCHLELPIHETEDLKIQIKFEPLQNNSAGKCHITLFGHDDSMLGVLISDIHLYFNNSEKEVLKVIVTNSGAEFVLQQYYGRSKYQPLLLTETHKVYLVLYYNVTNVPENKYSHFNLEVFSYHKYGNYVHKPQESISKPSSTSHNKLDKIFFTTEYPRFIIPYYF